MTPEEQLKQEAEEYFKNLNECRTKELMIQAYLEAAKPREKRIEELEAKINKMKRYIKACWLEENMNDYSSFITNTREEFQDLIKELNAEISHGR